MMKTYQGTHGVHILEYQSKINKLLCYLTNRYPRLMAVLRGAKNEKLSHKK